MVTLLYHPGFLTHTHDQMDDINYQCVVEIDGEEIRLLGTYVNQSKVICTQGHVFNSPITEGMVTAPIKVDMSFYINRYENLYC